MTGGLSDAVDLLPSPWPSTFHELVRLADEDLLLASPFISKDPLRSIAEVIESKKAGTGIRISIITDLAIDSMLSGSLDVMALLRFAESFSNVTVTYLPSLHAKVYVADNRAAVVTSANLTSNGLMQNHEYGILLRDSKLVAKVRVDLTKYASLGNTVPLETLSVLAQAAQDLKSVRQAADRSIRSRLRAEFEEKTQIAKLELLKARSRGKTTHGIFSDTILYLLEQRGSLTTVEMHPMVQMLHPDLCDDSVDRVIGNVHFGKKWKHYVRMAQQALKRRGVIDFDGHRWFLTGWTR